MLRADSHPSNRMSSALSAAFQRMVYLPRPAGEVEAISADKPVAGRTCGRARRLSVYRLLGWSL
jgi:hypothetical protein